MADSRIVLLSAVDTSQVSLYGDKAVYLSFAQKAGFAVPEGFVVMADAYGDYLNAGNTLPEAIQRSLHDAIAGHDTFLCLGGPTPCPGLNYIGLNDETVLSLAQNTDKTFAYAQYAAFIRDWAVLVNDANPLDFDYAEASYLSSRGIDRGVTEYDALALLNLFKKIAPRPVPAKFEEQVRAAVGAAFLWYSRGAEFRSRSGITSAPAVLVTETNSRIDLCDGTADASGCSYQEIEGVLDEVLVDLVKRVSEVAGFAVEVDFLRGVDFLMVTRVRRAVRVPTSWEFATRSDSMISAIGWGAASGVVGRDFFSCVRFSAASAPELTGSCGAISARGSLRSKLARYCLRLSLPFACAVPIGAIALQGAVLTLCNGRLFGGSVDVEVKGTQKVEPVKIELWAVVSTPIEAAMAREAGVTGILAPAAVGSDQVVQAAGDSVCVLFASALDKEAAWAAAASGAKRVLLFAANQREAEEGAGLVREIYFRYAAVQSIFAGGDWRLPRVEISAHDRVTVEFGADKLAACFHADEIAQGGRFFIAYDRLGRTAKVPRGPLNLALLGLMSDAMKQKAILWMNAIDSGSIAAAKSAGVSGIAVPVRSLFGVVL